MAPSKSKQVTNTSHWPGGWIGRDEASPFDPNDRYEREQIAYARRARSAYEAFLHDDLVDEHATIAMEYAMLRLLRTAWDLKLLSTVFW